ncbi:MAG: DUF1449 family protein [Tannerella sp.]|jgi:hypothetical protein|nr:DUF1449 family protein [Tannerella sp.]
MADLLYNLMHPLPNAVMTVIMAIIVVYWLLTLLFGIGLDDLDLGFDFDIDIDAPEVDIDADVDAVDPEHEVAPDKSPGIFMKFLSFVNVGHVPFMLVFSTFNLIIWLGTLITTRLLNITSWGLSSLLILIPIGIIGIFLTKYATKPMVKFFKEIGYQGEEAIDFLGRSGKMLSTIKDGKIGTAEFIIDNNPIKLSVKSLDGAEIKYGDYVVIMDETDDKKIYLVDKELSIRNY